MAASPDSRLAATRANGFDVTIVEHNLSLGGVCTACYLIDGCIHWLTGGPFLRLYEELGIVPGVPLRTLDEFALYRHARDGRQVSLPRDLAHTRDELQAVAPEDADEVVRLIDGAHRVADLNPNVDRPPELSGVADQLRTSGNSATTSARSCLSANRSASGCRST